MPEDLQLLPRSPMGALQHGCRSQQLLLEHEDPAEWRKLLAQYRDEYQPETELLDQFVLEAAQAHWFFLRTQRNLFDTQAALPRNPQDWTDEHHRKLALFLRYQTTAERSHQRALAKLNSYLRQREFRARLHEQQAAVKRAAAAPVAADANSTASASVKDKEAKKPEKPVIAEQWIEVRNVDNQVVVDFFPTNDELAAEIEQKKVKPTLLYRRLHFPNGVPSYYQWTRPRKGMATQGGMAMQRMTIETWEQLREVERKTGFAESTGKVTLQDWREAFNQHHGMQSTERFGVGTDPDGDGVVNELTRADITAAVLYQATLPVPARRIPENAAFREAVAEGEQLFSRIGCAGCHVPALPLDKNGWVYTEPGPYNPAGNLQTGQVQTISVDLSSGDLPQPRLRPSNGVVMVPLYTDFKLHDICKGPTDPNVEPLDANEPAGSPPFFAGNSKFLTRRLWAVGSKANYFHHGQFTTIREAILNHFGEALAAQTAFSSLGSYQQGSIIEFLKTLQLVHPAQL